MCVLPHFSLVSYRFSIFLSTIYSRDEAPNMATATGDSKRKAARSLFGRPEPGEVTRKLDNSLQRMYREESRKWNFDFAGGVPLVGAEGDIDFVSIPASDVPEFYREKIIRTRKTITRRDVSPVSDTLEAPEEPLFVVEPSEPQLLLASTSHEIEEYIKPVTRSSSAKNQQEVDTLKQTKLTNYMPVRKRRSETLPASGAVLMSRSISIDSNFATQKEKRGIKLGNNNKGAPKRPLRFVPPNIPKSAQSSVSDSALVSSPRSPPAKKTTVTSRRSRRPIEAGDF
ncbi:CRE-CKI-2 protein [Caenorhabditis remanei]|uniref:CRE-CKI-2 protein n=1 Tax=Caenorhabditis remanei TaxID=31234 RepID=E3MN27_CAERE|nr:CRE-CKI-2 protein [Caenorhabditis remanei]